MPTVKKTTTPTKTRPKPKKKPVTTHSLLIEIRDLPEELVSSAATLEMQSLTQDD